MKLSKARQHFNYDALIESMEPTLGGAFSINHTTKAALTLTVSSTV